MTKHTSLVGYFARASDGEVWYRVDIIAQVSPTHYVVRYEASGAVPPEAAPVEVVCIHEMEGWLLFESVAALKAYNEWVDQEADKEDGPRLKVVPYKGLH